MPHKGEMTEKCRKTESDLERYDGIWREQVLSQKNFSEFASEWMQDQQIFFKESTVVRYKNLLKLYLLPEFETYASKDFTYRKINEFRTKLLLTGGCRKSGLAPKTVSDTLSLLHNILRFADNRGFLVPEDSEKITVKQHKKRVRIFSVEEQNKLCRYLKSREDRISFGILLCLFTGLRIGEICALKWGDICMEEKTIYVHQTMQRLQTDSNQEKKTKILISTPKSDCSVRKIPISDEIFALIKKVRSSSESYFLTGSASKYIEPRTLQYQFKRILQKCEIADANFHTLRHTFATRCVEVGFDVKSLSEILGHANVNITLNRYVHPSMELKRDNMSKLSGLFAVE